MIRQSKRLPSRGCKLTLEMSSRRQVSTSLSSNIVNIVNDEEKEPETDTVYLYIESVRILGMIPKYPSIKIVFGEKRAGQLEVFMEYYSELEIVNKHRRHHILKPTKNARMKVKDGNVYKYILIQRFY
jgi:hypothetical protein